MTQIAVSDEIASTLASAAASRGCDQADLASALLEHALREQEDTELSPELEAFLLHRIQQSERGEFVMQEVVEAKFAALFQRLEAR